MRHSRYTFHGGVHPPENKLTAAFSLEVLPPPPSVAIPMSQHIGAPAVPVVSAGDTVFVGTVIGEAAQGLSLPVHSSVSGTVTGIEKRIDNFGRNIDFVIIESDGKQTVDERVKAPDIDLKSITTESLADILKSAGICGMGGATFPTYAKIQSAHGKVDRLIINCAECEPFITVNHRLMLEHAAELIGGTKILLLAVGVKQADIAIESNKPDAIASLREKTAGDDMISVCEMKTKYPEGDERQLIYALTGREIPSGKLPADVGCVVFNAETVYKVYLAFKQGMPLVERMVTVSGEILKNPKNLVVPIGTSYSYLTEYCGGFTEECGEIISGGPMMGRAEWTEAGVVTKGTGAVLFRAEPEREPEHCCIHCGRCSRACQMRLMPLYLAAYAEAENYEMCEKLGVMNCVECGACSYVCPGFVPIVQYNRLAKAKIRAAAAKKKEGKDGK